MREYKIVVVGNGKVGKTSLLESYVNNVFKEEYVSTTFNSFQTNIKVDEKDHFAHIFDMAGQENMSEVRPLSYQQSDVFIVCFSIETDLSFSQVNTRWIPELRHHQPNIPFIVVGTKQDLRGKRLLKTDKELDRSDGMRREEFYERKAKEWGAVSYVECSAKTRFNVEQVFEIAIKAAVTTESSKGRGKEKKKFCQLF